MTTNTSTATARAVRPTGRAAAASGRRPNLRRRETAAFWVFIAPWLIGLVCLVAGPMLFSLYASFTKWNGVGTPAWVGLQNYVIMFTADPQFLPSLGRTFYYAIGLTVFGTVFALALAAMLNTRLPGRVVFRSLFFLPSVIVGVPLFVAWTYIFDPTTGVLNFLLSLVGIKGPGWLTTPEWAMPSLILMGVTSIGGTIVVFLAGLQNIPQVTYEAAEIDGAGWWRRFRSVTVPLLSPVILFNVVTGLVASLQVFAQPYTMTAGGPVDATYVFGLYLYYEAFNYFATGYAAAMSWVLFAITVLLTLLVFLVARRRVFYEGGVS